MGSIKPTETGNNGNFEILVQTEDGVLINTGTGYDGYGNRLTLEERYFHTITSSDWAAITLDYAYLCIRKNSSPTFLDYQQHAVTNLPQPTKRLYGVEFYLVETVEQTDFPNNISGYYPPLDENDMIGGLVLGKLYKTIAPNFLDATKPSMAVKSPFLATKDGAYFPLAGFNKI